MTMPLKGPYENCNQTTEAHAVLQECRQGVASRNWVTTVTCFKDIAVGFSNLWSTQQWPRPSLHWSFCQTFWEFCTLFACTVAAQHLVSYLISSPLLPSTSPLFPPLLLWSFLLRSYASLLYPALLYFFTPQPRLSGLVDAVMNHPSALDFLAKTEEKHSLPKMGYPFHPLVHHIFFQMVPLKIVYPLVN